MSESGRSCVFASLGDNGSEKSERKQMEKNKAEISLKSLKSEEKGEIVNGRYRSSIRI